MRISDWSSDVCSSDLLVDVAIVDVADRALDQIAVAVDRRGRRRAERGVADLVPQPREIIEVALDLGLGARQPGGADDRSEERRVGKECVSPCRSVWWPDH